MPFVASSQGSEAYGPGIKLKVNEDGSKYIRFITWHQFWTRYTVNNPGTTINGENKNDDFDIALRRSRTLWYTQISPRFLVLMHIGINNQTFLNGGGSGTGGVGGYGVGKKPQVFIHDAWTEYTVVKDKLYIGTGLHYWNGVSRISSASTLNFLALDAPIFNWPLIEETDQFARQFGIYAKGKLGKLDYRIAANRPFATPNTETAIKAANGRAIAAPNTSWAAAGYFSFEFLDKESNLLPFFVGTYVGTKRVFNIGFGYHYHPDATASVQNGRIEKHNMLLGSVDAFLDMPISKEKGTAITAYSAFYNYDFGPDYIRSIGILNEGVPSPVAGALPQGAGNAQYTIGTGQIWYTEAGYLFGKKTLGNLGRLQGFGTLTYKDFDFVGRSSMQWGLGFNYFMEGHFSKISLKYDTRPLYAADPLNPGGLIPNPEKRSAGQFILQTMIWL
jgi:hypothetical protein